MAIQVTGSMNVSGSISGSMSGSFQGDGSKLTGVPVGFPYSGSAEITGSFVVSGSLGITGSFVATGSIVSTGSIQSTGSVEFSFANRSGVWSTAPGLNVNRERVGGVGNDVNAALAFGGYGSNFQCTEEYNGATWSPSAALQNGGYSIAGAGTQTAALAVGGDYRSDCTEEYNGATWSPGGTLSDTTYGRSAAGTQNAALATGGRFFPNDTCTEEYNGASWASGGALQIGVKSSVSVGTQNAALAFGGYSDYVNADTNATQQYNDSTWSLASSLNHAIRGHAGAGTETSALSFGGYDTNYTEEYDGTSWSMGGNLSNIRGDFGGAGGSKASALAFGGYPLQSTSEEYAPGSAITKTFDYDESTGLTDITDLKVHNLTHSGTFTTSGSDAQILLDRPQTPINAWRTSGNTILERWKGISGQNQYQQVLSIGGEDPYYAVNFSTTSRMVEKFDSEIEVWSGTNYTNIIRCDASADQDLIVGGRSNNNYNICSEILGNSPNFGFGPIWTTAAAPTTERIDLAQGDRVIFGGYDGTAVVNCTEEYDSFTNTWSTCTGMSLGRERMGGSSPDDRKLATGGSTTRGGFPTTCTEMYDFGVWTTCAGMGASRKQHAAAGVGDRNDENTLIFGGGSYCSEQFDPTSNTWTNRGGLLSTSNYANGNASYSDGKESPMAFSNKDYNNQSFIFNWKGPHNPDCALNYDSSELTESALTARGSFEGEFKGCFNGQACSALESGFASIANTANTAATASYVDSDAVDFSTLNNYADDASAAAGGVPIGSLYRNGNFIVIRLT